MLHYFAGGSDSPYELMVKYDISHTVVMEGVWYYRQWMQTEALGEAMMDAN